MTRLELTVRGIVQGVGFRPFVLQKARALGLVGFVQNRRGSVAVEVQGPPGELECFVGALEHEARPPARVESVERRDLEERADDSFVIRASAEDAGVEPALPADLAACRECRAEVLDPRSRRYGYPFTTCARCGPRYSIVQALPYDRERTTMRAFALCERCSREYLDPNDRRFHAEPIACSTCGPRLSLLDAAGGANSVGWLALERAARALQDGAIVAVRGLGGYQLLVDATSRSAVERLRRRKHRDEKPFAVMFATIGELRRHALVADAERAALEGAEAPILLLRRRLDTRITDLVAPRNPCVGAMLPTTPLHELLLRAVGRPVVCTSGNRSGEPMCTETDDAVYRLGGIADWLLDHDRPIVRPIDDSVGRLGPRGLELLRRARGFAPNRVTRIDDSRTILALGAHLKSTVALAHRGNVVVSQHLGDLQTADAVGLLERTARDLCSFFDARLDLVACDLHPDYASTRLAECLANELGVPLVRVAHHHAHVAACLAEHRIERPVLGLAWDGTGLGTDGTSWGGEALLVDGQRCERFGHLLPFRLPGGDRAAREPRRAALGLLERALGEAGRQHARRWFEEHELATLGRMLERGVSSPLATGMGRLFDAVAALAGLCARTSFEGQAAMELQFAAERHAGDVAAYSLDLSAERPHVADWTSLVRDVVADAARGAPVELVAARFHSALVELGLAWAERAGIPDVVLTGGCFQNAWLSGRLRERLEGAGFTVHTPALIPPNDGGISLGQIRIAALAERSS
jgi:hydrogenase maturation protein HypF